MSGPQNAASPVASHRPGRTTRIHLDEDVIDHIVDVAWLAKKERGYRPALGQVNIEPGFVWATDAYRLAIIEDDLLPAETLSIPHQILDHLPTSGGVTVTRQEVGTAGDAVVSWKVAGETHTARSYPKPGLGQLFLRHKYTSVVERERLKRHARSSKATMGESRIVTLTGYADVETVVNAQFLAEGLRWLHGHTVRLYLPESRLRPMTFIDEEQRSYILMPVRRSCGCDRAVFWSSIVPMDTAKEAERADVA